MRTPKITIHGWAPDGPVYTVHANTSGWRNRRNRGADDARYGFEEDPAEAESSAEPAASLLYAHGDLEVWAFNAGYVYEVDMLIDGHAISLLVDSRQGITKHEFRDGVEKLAHRALTEDEVADIDDGYPRPEPSDVSDGAESQEAAEEHSEAATEGDAQAEGQPSVDDGDMNGEHVEEAHDDEHDDDEPSLDSDYPGTIGDLRENLDAIDDDTLVRLAVDDSRKGIRDLAEAEVDRRSQA
jgi:hypothetical protein